jgi:riboflavin kinase / FMN adenylyltransferase
LKKLVGLESMRPSASGSAVTVGTFDGLHVGHRSLVARTIELARADDLESTVLTWDRHPFATLRPDHVPPLISSSERKIELIEESGADAVVVLPFDKELSTWPPERFVTRVLSQGLAARVMVVGRGWRFGHKAAGDVALLDHLGREAGFSVEEMPVAEAGGGPASSSRVRAAVSSGDVTLARTLLGRPFDIDGVVVRGAARGAGLGYPTANLEVDPALVHPANGVYAGRARAGDIWYSAAVNVGVVPHFGGREGETPVKIEAYLLDFEGDLYGQFLRLEFHERLREERTFDSVDALIEQMGRDVQATRTATC